VRYLHPSDQAAALDWDAFLPAAIDRVLGARDPAALLAELRAVFAAVAPTAVFSMDGDPPGPLPAAPGGTHLARWRRYGPGSPSRYPSFREGREREDDVTVSEVITVPPPVTWAGLPSRLARARALIFDFRGYSTLGLDAVSHLIAHPIDQLTWEIPELPHPGRPIYAPVRRALYPSAPRFAAPVIALVDGESASTVETTLAMIRDHRLGVLVGERTAGTSGLVSNFTIPGGYTIRFTAIRLADAAGATLHGRGIVPDLVVHPTLDGVRAGRDEILEAGIAAAQRAAGLPLIP
jgi:hypothetical protein